MYKAKNQKLSILNQCNSLKISTVSEYRCPLTLLHAGTVNDVLVAVAMGR